LANGHALAALLGRRDVMSARNKTHIDGTFSFDTLPMAAAMATLDVYETTDYYDRLREVGGQLRDGFNAAFLRHGVRAEAKRLPSVFHVIFEDEEFAAQFYPEILRRGVLMQPLDSPTFVTAAHTAADVRTVLEHANAALEAVCARLPPDRSGAAPGSVNALALNRRTLCEFGAVVDYRAEVEQVPQDWADAGTRSDAILT
jgi:glutamate-1-semialdehyde aminotransferase